MNHPEKPESSPVCEAAKEATRLIARLLNGRLRAEYHIRQEVAADMVERYVQKAIDAETAPLRNLLLSQIGAWWSVESQGRQAAENVKSRLKDLGH